MTRRIFVTFLVVLAFGLIEQAALLVSSVRGQIGSGTANSQTNALPI
jgi:hypothetical protein